MKKILAIMAAGLMAAPMTVVADQIFYESFTGCSKNVDSSATCNDWVETGNATVTEIFGHTYSQKLLGDSSITRSISTLGYTDISLYFNWGASGCTEHNGEHADHLYVEWSTDGNVWNTAMDRTLWDGGWRGLYVSLTPGAENSSDFQLRFRSTTTWEGEAAYVDNIKLKGRMGQVSVPEPGTLALFGLGLVGLGFSRRRKQH